MSGVETDGKNVLLVVDDNADPRKHVRASRGERLRRYTGGEWSGGA